MQRAHLTVVLKSQPKRVKYFITAFIGLVIIIVAMQYHRSVNFSYAGQNCFRDVTILPAIFQSKGDGVYAIYSENPLAIKSYPILSTKSCVYAVKAPVENEVKKVFLSVFNITLPNKKFSVKADDFPKLDTTELSKKISIRDPLNFPLDKNDKVFEYWLVQGKNRIACEKNSTTVACDVGSLKLKQNQAYTMSVERYFDNQAVGSVAQNTVTTVEPVKIINTSVALNGLVYDKPTEIIVAVNKNLISAKTEFKLLGLNGKNTDIAYDQIIDKNQIRLKLKAQLERNANYQVTIIDSIAEDKGVLFETYNLAFKTSGGPKVSGISVGHNSVEPGNTIVVNFDQSLLSTQAVASLVQMNTSSGAVPAKVLISGNKLLIKPSQNLPICTKFNIKLSTNILNQYGVGGDSSWTLDSRIRCYTTSNIGFSAQGRAITAWHFGSGANKYIFFGTSHGDEKSTKYLMDRWIDELDVNFDKLPAGVSVIVIPNLNPDGFASNSRRNANGVDLNRNFPANDWKKDVTMPGGELVVNGGGITALSEPESKAIANFVTANNPRLVLTYHSVASIVSGNSTGFADSVAVGYAKLSGYNYSAFGEEENVFHYDTTGAFETWMHDKIGIPTILVELGSSTYSEFNLNRSAMWAVFNN